MHYFVKSSTRFSTPVLLVLLLVAMSASLVLMGFARATEAKRMNPVQVATDLKGLAYQSQQQHIPILLVYSAESCEYCERLEEELLSPMLSNGEFEGRAIVRKVMIDSIEDIKDFFGNAIVAEEFAFQQGVDVTPTLHFVDAKGKQLAAQMIGYNTPEMFAAYMQNAIDASKTLIEQRTRQ